MVFETLQVRADQGNNVLPNDHDSGEILWEDKTNDEWTDNDEELLNALLMYGNLEQTIGEYYV